MVWGHIGRVACKEISYLRIDVKNPWYIRTEPTQKDLQWDFMKKKVVAQWVHTHPSVPNHT